MFLLFICLLFSISKYANSGKILLVPAHVGPSHAFPLFQLADALASHSHDVLVWYPTGIPPERVTRSPKVAKMDAFYAPANESTLLMEAFVYENLTSDPSSSNYVLFEQWAYWSPKTDLHMFANLAYEAYFFTLVSQEYQKAILRDHRDRLDQITNQKWDLVIADDMMCPVGHLISELTKAPLIIYCTTMLQEGLAFNFDQPVTPSYKPGMYSPFPYGNMTFWQRVRNTISVGLDVLTSYIEHTTVSKDLASYLDGAKGFRSYWEIRQSAAFVFIVFPAKLEYPMPWLSNVINMGNPSCQQVEQKLAKDLENRIKAYKGVIVFAFGHYISWETAPRQAIENLAEAFEEFPDQLVIWKMDAEPPKNLPKNVLIMEFVPQPALLNHPKAKLFISHGGLSSVSETICAGVPVLGIPFGADQTGNLARMVRHNVGLVLQSSELLSSQKIIETLQKLLTSERYKKNMMGLKESFGDDYMTNLERGVFWSEFAMRHEGAGPFKTSLEGLSTIAYFNLDFWALFVVVLCLMIYLVKILACKFVGCAKKFV